MQQQEQSYDLAGQVIGCAMKVHRSLGYGFSEKVYKNSLAIELRKHNIECEVEKKIKVSYEGVIVGDYAADIMVKNDLIIELKATQGVVPAHEVQLVNYLTATGIDEGLLLNFGTSSLQYKKKFKDSNTTQSSAPALQS